MPRTTHETEITFDLDPTPGDSRDRPGLTVYAAAEQTAKGHPSYFDRVTGDADPGGPDEYDIHTVQVWDYSRKLYRDIRKDEWECLFGPESWRNLLAFLEGELESA